MNSNGYEIMPVEEYHKMMRNLPDSNVVPVWYIKETMSWLQSEGYNGKHLSSEGLIMVAERILYWMSQNSSIERAGIVN